MSTFDLLFFLVAAILGVWHPDKRLAWGVVGIWALLRLVHIL